jgi:uncharacterized protein YjiS (DUF1127 family)
MAYSSTTRTATFANPAMLLEGMVERFSQYRRFRRTMTELSGLSDSQLADLGLTRSMLHATAVEATYGKVR